MPHLPSRNTPEHASRVVNIGGTVLAGVIAAGLLAGTLAPAGAVSVGSASIRNASAAQTSQAANQAQAARATARIRIGRSSFALAGTNLARRTNKVVIYKAPRRTTPKSKRGVDVQVVRGKVARVQVLKPGTRRVRVPTGGYVVSGKGAAARWLRSAARVGAAVATWRHVSPAPVARPASALPSRVVASYWPTWSGTRLTALPTGTTGYNVILLAFATPGTSNPGGGTGAVTYNHGSFNHATIKADIAALRAKGVKVLLSVGGAGSYTHLNTDARRNAFYNSIRTIYGQIGPFDGLDWNLETNWSYTGTVYNRGVTTAKGTLPRILWICAALKTDYPGFLFTKPPSPSSTHDRTWINAMNSQNTFDLVMPQYYDGGGGEFPNNISFWTSAAGVGTASKVAPGIIDNQRYSQYGSGTGTQSSILSRWNSAASTYPGLRGAMYWHTGIDAQTTGGSQSSWFATTFGATVRSR